MAVLTLSHPAQTAPKPTRASQAMTDDQLLTEVQKRAFRFFWEQSDPKTGLTKDRAKNVGDPDNYIVASTASTGYALAALPIAVTHGWIDKQAAYDRALTTLRFIHDKLPAVHGWYYHFLDWRTGEREWKCELSSIDTVLLIEGALMAGQFWPGTEVQKLADDSYDRMDWVWMRTNDHTQTEKLLVSMGWKPEDGFIKSNWDHYCELMQLYLLGLGSRRYPLPVSSWAAWKRNEVSYKGMTTLAGEAIFIHEMSHAYFDFKDQRDSMGYDYWVSSRNGVNINRQFCLDHSAGRKSYGPNLWGLNANDAPDGYKAYGAPGEEDGTISPTGAIASILFTPDLASAAAQEMHTRVGDKGWGRYGFANGFNLDKNWIDPDVIGIDLGMALLAIEDTRTGLPWKLMSSHPQLQRAWKLAGFHKTTEPEPRPLHVAEKH